jgi:hypothetical protein
MTTRNVVLALMLLLAASAWITYARQPTRGNLRRAVRKTLPLL